MPATASRRLPRRWSVRALERTVSGCSVVCQYYRLVGNADYGCYGSVDICGGSANHRSDDSRGGNPHVGNRDSADRSFAEPMFAASIVAYGVFVGVGNTFVPSLMNFGSIWGVRLTLAAWLAPTMGLRGVWLAMCIELCFRGVIFLARLWGSNWIYKLRINR